MANLRAESGRGRRQGRLGDLGEGSFGDGWGLGKSLSFGFLASSCRFQVTFLPNFLFEVVSFPLTLSKVLGSP